MPAFLPIGGLRTGEHRHAAGVHDCVRGRLGAAGAHPELHRPFKTPLVPLVPILGHSLRRLPDDALERITWIVMMAGLSVGW
jgi:hypothetical protein